jgi:hypothetical protein
LRGAKRRSNPVAGEKKWIASRSLSSGAHSRYPLARNDGIKRLISNWEKWMSTPRTHQIPSLPAEEKGIRRNVIGRAVTAPFGRQGAGGEIAHTALFLISNEKFYVNAHRLFVGHLGGIVRG